MSPAEEWQVGGKFFTWQSTLPENHARPVKIFYVCMGDEAKPAIVMIHGFPTSSFDFRPLMTELQKDYRVGTFDFPGYGMSDKPANNYPLRPERGCQAHLGFRHENRPAQGLHTILS